MRLQCPPEAKEKTHFLTDFYASAKRFNLPLAHFVHYNENAYLKFYNEDAVRIKGKHNRPFYRYGGHIELIRFKEYYRMPRGHEHISFVFSNAFRDIFS